MRQDGDGWQRWTAREGRGRTRCPEVKELVALRAHLRGVPLLRLRLTVSHLGRLAVGRLTGRSPVAVVGWVGVHRSRRRTASAAVEGLLLSTGRGSSVGLLLLLLGLAVEGLLGLTVGLRVETGMARVSDQKEELEGRG